MLTRVIEGSSFTYGLYDGMVHPRHASVWNDSNNMGNSEIHNLHEAMLPVCPAGINVSYQNKVPVNIVKVVCHGVKVGQWILQTFRGTPFTVLLEGLIEIVR